MDLLLLLLGVVHLSMCHPEDLLIRPLIVVSYPDSISTSSQQYGCNLTPQHRTPRPRRTRSPADGTIPTNGRRTLFPTDQRLHTLHPSPILRLQYPPAQIDVVRMMAHGRLGNDRMRPARCATVGGGGGDGFLPIPIDERVAVCVLFRRGRLRILGEIVMLLRTQELSGMVWVHRTFHGYVSNLVCIVCGIFSLCWKRRRDAFPSVISLFAR